MGEVLSVNGNEITVAFGLLKSTVKADRLEKVSKNQIKKENSKATFISSQTTDDMREKQLNFKQEIDVRGMRADEALQAVTYFIDDAIQVGCTRVRILHALELAFFDKSSDNTSKLYRESPTSKTNTSSWEEPVLRSWN